MRRLAKEIFEWDNKKCFEHMVTYATIPPILSETFENSHGMRFWQANVLKTLGDKYHVDKWIEASMLFRHSGKSIIELCKAAIQQDKQTVSTILIDIAHIEGHAYGLLQDGT